MTVKLLAYTQLDDEAVEYSKEDFKVTGMTLDESSRDTEDLIELAGRTCYDALDKPNPKTRSNKDYLANIIRLGHESVFEHASATFLVSEVSRNLLIELSRHRFISLSVESTRYVDQSERRVIIPPAMRIHGKPVSRPLHGYEKTLYQDKVERLMEAGKTRKEAREAAVSELPGNLETQFIVTANLRAWRGILALRWNVAANAEIREWAGEILGILRTKVAPSAFQDFPDKPFGTEEEPAEVPPKTKYLLINGPTGTLYRFKDDQVWVKDLHGGLRGWYESGAGATEERVREFWRLADSIEEITKKEAKKLLTQSL